MLRTKTTCVLFVLFIGVPGSVHAIEGTSYGVSGDTRGFSSVGLHSNGFDFRLGGGVGEGSDPWLEHAHIYGVEFGLKSSITERTRWTYGVSIITYLNQKHIVVDAFAGIQHEIVTNKILMNLQWLPGRLIFRKSDYDWRGFAVLTKFTTGLTYLF